MLVSRLVLRNWRNFREVDIRLRERNYVLGANASGKSNLLDVFRFLRDIAKPRGGGLQQAVSARGGLSKLRCLHARKPNHVRIEIELSDSPDAPEPTWIYSLSFAHEGKGPHRVIIDEERVTHEGRLIVQRPDDADKQDTLRLTETHLENVQSNSEFRPVAEFLMGVNYLHLVPQLLKYSDEIGGKRLENDPFGQGFLERIAGTTPRARDSRLGRIQQALRHAVPQFEGLRFAKDETTGAPHLEMRYQHHRPKAGWQREDQFSDGTLRLIALLWSLLESDSMLLLEEPELSLNSEIVEQIPLLISRVLRDSKKRRQVLISSHSSSLMNNNGIDARSIIMLTPSGEGTIARHVNSDEQNALEDGFSPAEVLLPKTRPGNVGQLSLEF